MIEKKQNNLGALFDLITFTTSITTKKVWLITSTGNKYQLLCS